MKTYNNYWDQLVELMNDDIREAVHAELAPCTNTDFGSGDYICVDEAELRRLAFGWNMKYQDLLEQVHEASEAEIKEYGVYDSEEDN